jgi:hypothetical protein
MAKGKSGGGAGSSAGTGSNAVSPANKGAFGPKSSSSSKQGGTKDMCKGKGK